MSMVSSVVGGVDTHADVHVAAALDLNGAVLGIESFPTDTAGYRLLADGLIAFGSVVKVGVEGTGSYGVGLARFLHANGVEVVEVDRPNRQKRRRGKSDPIDAEAAARAALSGEASVTPKWRDGTVEQITSRAHQNRSRVGGGCRRRFGHESENPTEAPLDRRLPRRGERALTRGIDRSEPASGRVGFSP